MLHRKQVLYKHHKVVPIYLRFLNKLDSILFKITKSQIQSHEIFLWTCAKNWHHHNQKASVTQNKTNNKIPIPQTEILNGKVDHMFKPKRYNSEIEISGNSKSIKNIMLF
jgi:hypothetical protein